MVSRVVLLDSGPLGLATNPKPSPNNLACSEWLQSLIEARIRVVVPEIADYEVRRELLRASKFNGLALLDTLAESLEYLPLTTSTMRRAARLWADARQSGQPTMSTPRATVARADRISLRSSSTKAFISFMAALLTAIGWLPFISKVSDHRFLHCD